MHVHAFSRPSKRVTRPPPTRARAQAAKQAALGPAHDTSLLPSVLAEPMLGETWRKAGSFREQGWSMKYKLHRMKVGQGAGEGLALSCSRYAWPCCAHAYPRAHTRAHTRARAQVTAVDVSKASGRRPLVTVTASLDESASLCGMDGREADGYRSSYDAQYTVVQVRGGARTRWCRRVGRGAWYGRGHMGAQMRAHAVAAPRHWMGAAS